MRSNEKKIELTVVTIIVVAVGLLLFSPSMKVAAAKANDGRVYLHSVHLASNRQSDVQWDPLYGHIMWPDWMAEENVNQ